MRTWRAIADEIEQTDDPKKISELAEELNRALLEEERLNVRRKIIGR